MSRALKVRALSAIVAHTSASFHVLSSPTHTPHSLRHSGSVEVSLGLCNTTGLGERVKASAEYGSRSSNTYTLDVTRRRLGASQVTAALCAHQVYRSALQTSSYEEKLVGGSLGVSRCVDVA